MNIQDLKQLTPKHYWTILYLYAGLIASGFMIIFHFRPELVEKYDIMKLLMLSSSIGLIPTALNVFPLLPGTMTADNEHNEQAVAEAFAIASLVTYGITLICLTISYLFHLKFKVFLGTFAGLETVTVITLFRAFVK